MVVERCRTDRDDHQRRAGWGGRLVDPWCIKMKCVDRKKSERKVAIATLVKGLGGMAWSKMASKQGQAVADSQEAARTIVSCLIGADAAPARWKTG
jgi:hypothetical protein